MTTNTRMTFISIILCVKMSEILNQKDTHSNKHDNTTLKNEKVIIQNRASKVS